MIETIYAFDDFGNRVPIGTFDISNIPSSLTVGGSWTNIQYVNTAPDTTGLNFTCTYNDGTIALVNATLVSPLTWSSTAGTQIATFSYTEGGVTVTATKTADVREALVPKQVGGKVYYIDSTAEGTYQFYDANGDPVSAPAVGTDCTGWTYTVIGADKDKYYVYNDNYRSDCRWTYYVDGQAVYTAISGLLNSIGSGRNNTNIVMAADDGAYVTSDAGGYPTMWYALQQMNNNEEGGCDDWYVPSRDEAEKLREAITFVVLTTSDDPVILPAGPVTGGNIASAYDGSTHYKDYNDTRTCYPSNTVFLRKKYYSSSQNNAQNAVAWRYSNQYWGSNSKHENMNFFAIRSF